MKQWKHQWTLAKKEYLKDIYYKKHLPHYIHE